MTTANQGASRSGLPVPRFSVVVPVYNNPADLRNCLTSLKTLNFARDGYEIIIVDNNSTDATPEVAREFGVTCLKETEFQSSYAARNQGIKAARGSFVAFTDSDCIAHPDWLKEIDAVTGDEAVGCFAGEILSVSPTTTVERFSDKIGLLRQKGPLSGWHFKPYAQTANAVYRKAVFDRIGLFDPTMKAGGDAAIAWRMLDKTNHTIRFVPDAIVYHHHRTSVADLYAQFRRYGGGKMSWALHQMDYAPPPIAALENDVISLLQKHVQMLESNGADDETLFSVLKATTQVAHLSGYLQDLLRHTTGGQPVDKVTEIARDRAPICNICRSRSFVPGPDGRLIKGRPPQCRDCGSLERHRILFSFFSKADTDAGSKTCLSVGEGLRNEVRIFRTHRQTAFGDLLKDQSGQRYDVVTLINIFATNPTMDVATVLEGSVKALHESSTLILYESLSHDKDGRIYNLGIDVARHLPNARVFSENIRDHATDETGIVVVAQPEDISH